MLFKKLKNYRIQRHDENYIGEVVDAIKGSHLAIMVKANTLSPDQRLKFITPEGKELSAPVMKLENFMGKSQNEILGNSLALINYVGGVWVKSAVYLES